MLKKKDEKQQSHLLHSTRILCNRKRIFHNRAQFLNKVIHYSDQIWNERVFPNQCLRFYLIMNGVLKMKFIVYDNVHDFERKIESFLLEKEDVFSLFYGVLQAIKAGNYENPFTATIEEDGNVLAFFQMTPPIR